MCRLITILLLISTLISCSKYPEDDVDIYTWTYSYEPGSTYGGITCLEHSDEYKLEIPEKGKVLLFKNGEIVDEYKKKEFYYSKIGENEITVDSILFSSNVMHTSHFVNDQADCHVIQNKLGDYVGVYSIRLYDGYPGGPIDTTFNYTAPLQEVPSSKGCLVQYRLDWKNPAEPFWTIRYVNQNGQIMNSSIYVSGDRMYFNECIACYGQYAPDPDWFYNRFEGFKLD